MSHLKLYYHPLSSYCWKALIAFYENNTPFEPVLTHDAESWDHLAALWPIRKFPLLQDEARDTIVAESSIIIEYLSLHYPGEFLPIPADADAALEVRFLDRVFDHYVMDPMASIVGDRIRPEDANKDPFGVAKWRAQLATSYDVLEKRLAGRSSKERRAGHVTVILPPPARPTHYSLPVTSSRHVLQIQRHSHQLRPRPGSGHLRVARELPRARGRRSRRDRSV